MKSRWVFALAAASLTLGACSTIADNVTVDVDGIIASTCTQLADKFTEELASVIVEIDANTDADLPDIDVGALIDKAEALGCSPDEMRRLVADNLEKVDSTSQRARGLIDQVSSDLSSVSG